MFHVAYGSLSGSPKQTQEMGPVVLRALRFNAEPMELGGPIFLNVCKAKENEERSSLELNDTRYYRRATSIFCYLRNRYERLAITVYRKRAESNVLV